MSAFAHVMDCVYTSGWAHSAYREYIFFLRHRFLCLLVLKLFVPNDCLFTSGSVIQCCRSLGLAWSEQEACKTDQMAHLEHGMLPLFGPIHTSACSMLCVWIFPDFLAISAWTLFTSSEYRLCLENSRHTATLSNFLSIQIHALLQCPKRHNWNNLISSMG